MPTNDRRPPNWGTVWLEARRLGRDPIQALIGFGLVDAEAVRPGPPPPSPARPPVPELPRRRLGVEGLDPAGMEAVRAELAARPVRADPPANEPHQPDHRPRPRPRPRRGRAPSRS